MQPSLPLPSPGCSSTFAREKFLCWRVRLMLFPFPFQGSFLAFVLICNTAGLSFLCCFLLFLCACASICPFIVSCQLVFDFLFPAGVAASLAACYYLSQTNVALLRLASLPPDSTPQGLLHALPSMAMSWQRVVCVCTSCCAVPLFMRLCVLARKEIEDASFDAYIKVKQTMCNLLFSNSSLSAFYLKF